MSRRTVLAAGSAAAGALATGGCRLTGVGRQQGEPPSQVTSTIAGTLRLMAAYDATLASFPDLATTLSPLRAEHASHLSALSRLAGIAVPSAPAAGDAPASVPGDPASALAALKAGEAAGQSDATQACLAAPAPYAALLGSITACRATHQEVLA